MRKISIDKVITFVVYATVAFMATYSFLVLIGL